MGDFNEALKVVRMGRCGNASRLSRSRGVSVTSGPYFIVMTDTKHKTASQHQVQAPAEQGQLHSPTPLQAALLHFIKFAEDPEQTKRTVFKLLHLAFESDTVLAMDRYERSNLFFVARELMMLTDSIFLQKKCIFKQSNQPKK